MLWPNSGYLHQVHARVYAVGHRAPSVEADLTAAALYAGPKAMLSHATAIWCVHTPRPRDQVATTTQAPRTEARPHAESPGAALPAMCERVGIPLPDVNVYIEGVLVDAVSRDRKLVVELDGRDNHSSSAQIQCDRSKELRLRAAGYDVIRYGTRQLE